jgi:plasmid stabilization system protein ParE
MPKLFAIVYRSVRRCKTRRFPYVIYYRIVKNRVEVLAIVHASRSPEAWKNRV